MLHVTNGDFAVPRLRAAGVRGDVLPWRDVLHEGPVPAGLDDAGLRAVRARFLAGGTELDEDEVATSLAERDARLASAARDGEPITLWFESDLYDVLQLLQILERIPPTQAALALVDRDPWRGVAELETEELAALEPAPVTQAQHPLAALAWAAFRAPDPSVLHVLAARTPELPAVGHALRRHLEQFPWAGSGLSRSERALLAAIDAGAGDREAAFRAAQGEEERPFLGDATAFGYLDRLAGGPAPLLDDITLTAHGREVLAGADWRGQPERHLGGITLAAGAPRWRWDPATGRLASAA
jgi:Domain of unknown function (DUF1835)